uniref:Coronin n=1 Tax=Myripristis murdjan TaxID=586833 RepID=A0A667YPM6_9TELE
GNHIKVSSKLVAFNTEQADVSPKLIFFVVLSFLPRPFLDVVTDLDFSPFDDRLLATCSADETMKLWRVCDPEQEQPSEAELTLSPGQGRLELVLFHPTSSGLLALGANKCPLIWDTSRQDAPLAVLEQHGDQLQSLSWKQDGSLLASSLSHCMTDTSTRGVAMVPKLALDVMSCEVVRVLQLTDSCIVPISYQVPRKEFHADLYPDTVGTTPAMSAEEWWKGGNKQVRTPYSHFITLHPKESYPSLSLSCTASSSAAPSRSPSTTSGLSSGFLPSPSPSQSIKTLHNLMGIGSHMHTSCRLVWGPSSKFRHIQGAVMHKDTHITNLRGLNLTTPGECDGFCANARRVAVPLAIAGGQIAVFELSQPGKLPDTALPTIQNSVNVADFCWDPFDTHRLAVAGDDAKIRLWQVPEGGLTETLTEPELIVQGHTEKIYSIKFHPLASDLLVSSSYDLTVRLWDLEKGEQVKVLTGHQDQVFGMAWSPDGKLLATVCKDGKVRIYDPRKSAEPVQEGPGPEGHRGARVVWVCDGKYLLVSGFDSRSERELYLFSAESLSSGTIAVAPADVSPSTLIPFYDPDTSVVILTGKGDTRVYIFEIMPEAPYFLECSSFNSPEPHKGLAFLPKTECSVREVEVARALMLSKTSIEPVAFTVPRVKKEFFQDDVYPDTAVWWEPALTASAWLSGSNGQHRRISLKPKDMTPVSEAPKEAPVRKYLPSAVYLEEKTDEQKKEELLSAMVAKLGNLDDPLPQDSFEGVDDDEWVSEVLDFPGLPGGPQQNVEQFNCTVI